MRFLGRKSMKSMKAMRRAGLRVGFSLTLLGTMLGELFASQRGSASC